MAETLHCQEFDVQENKLIQLPTNSSPNAKKDSAKSAPNTLTPLANSAVTTAHLSERYGVGDRSVQLLDNLNSHRSQGKKRLNGSPFATTLEIDR